MRYHTSTAALGQSCVGGHATDLGLFQACALRITCIALYQGFLSHGANFEAARTAALIAVTAGNLALALVNSSREVTVTRMLDRDLTPLWITVLVAVLVVDAVKLIPAMGRIVGGCLPSLWLNLLLQTLS